MGQGCAGCGKTTICVLAIVVALSEYNDLRETLHLLFVTRSHDAGTRIIEELLHQEVRCQIKDAGKKRSKYISKQILWHNEFVATNCEVQHEVYICVLDRTTWDSGFPKRRWNCVFVDEMSLIPLYAGEAMNMALSRYFVAVIGDENQMLPFNWHRGINMIPSCLILLMDAIRGNLKYFAESRFDEDLVLRMVMRWYDGSNEEDEKANADPQMIGNFIRKGLVNEALFLLNLIADPGESLSVDDPVTVEEPFVSTRRDADTTAFVVSDVEVWELREIASRLDGALKFVNWTSN